jgi:hypothetical protein
MKRLLPALSIILTSLLLPSCAAGAAQKASVSSPMPDTGPRVTFASPDPGVTVPFGPVRIIILSEDPRGTAQIEILVDETSIATVPSPDIAKTAVIIDYEWQPAATGKHVLQARGQNNAGTWGDIAGIEVTVAEAAAEEVPTAEVEPPSTEPTAEQTSVISTPAELTPTPTPQEAEPTATRSGITVTWTLAFMSMYKYGSNCEPQKNSVYVKVEGIDNSQIGGVVMWFRPTDQNTGEMWPWQGRGLELFPSGKWGYGFSTGNMVAKGKPFPFIPSVVLFQFSVSDKSMETIYRTEIFNSLTVKACGS